MRRALPRGFTLAETMVAIGVSSVIILSAVLSASTMMAMTRGQSKRSSAEAALALATVSLDRSLANAGSNFGNARYALRTRNNVTGATILTGNLPVVALGAAGAGVVAGTDVLEIAWSKSLRRTGQVTVLSPTAITLGTQDPLAQEEYSGAALLEPVTMLVERESDPTQSCLVKVKNPTTGPASVGIDKLLDEDFAVTGGNCLLTATSGDVVAYKLDQRARFFVYQKANGAELGLYRQDMDTSAGSTGVFADVTVAGNEPKVVALGVEDLQIAPSFGHDFNGATEAYGTCTADPAAGQPHVCTCSDGPAAVCTMTAAGLVTGIGANKLSLMRSAQLQFTTRGQRNPQGLRPASFDHAAGAVDGFERVQGTLSITLYNGYLGIQ